MFFLEGFGFKNVRFQNIQLKDFWKDKVQSKNFVFHLPIYSTKNALFWEEAIYKFKLQTAGRELKQWEIKFNSVAGGQIQGP